jgi:hypothetical protein
LVVLLLLLLLLMMMVFDRAIQVIIVVIHLGRRDYRRVFQTQFTQRRHRRGTCRDYLNLRRRVM